MTTPYSMTNEEYARTAQEHPDHAALAALYGPAGGVPSPAWYHALWLAIRDWFRHSITLPEEAPVPRALRIEKRALRGAANLQVLDRAEIIETLYHTARLLQVAKDLAVFTPEIR